MIDEEKNYLALQVDQAGASFDNIRSKKSTISDKQTTY